ncbi:MAG: hypothetical protein ABI840_08775 [bacterium]
MKIYIDNSLVSKEAVKYIFEIFLKNKKIDFSFVKDTNADFIISNSSFSDMEISEDFFKSINSGIYDFDNYFKDDCTIKTRNGSIDYLSTAFYMINCIQEYSKKDLDVYKRFKYAKSYQFHYKNIEVNLVQELFDKLMKSNRKLNQLSKPDTKTKFFLSHDIDTVYGALLQDGFKALKQKKLNVIIKLFFNVLMQRPDWLNIDKIMNIENEYDFKSTFYWLVNKGKLNELERNSDYSINDKKIRRSINFAQERNWENGLHKSISKQSFKEEISKLRFKPLGNRYHYLKFLLPDAYKDIEDTDLKLDSSLGFADVIGFRNSYGLPFHPYNFENKEPYNFLEVPLNIMDQTFYGYEKLPPEQIGKKVISFFEKNNTNCVISVLWHNNFFSNYKFSGYLEAYKEILGYLYESRYECVNQEELLKSNY